MPNDLLLGKILQFISIEWRGDPADSDRKLQRAADKVADTLLSDLFNV